jgi:hypothetical protein
MSDREAVGTCGTCGGSVTLQLEHGRRSAACPCGAVQVPERFFAINERGDSAQVGLRGGGSGR